MPARKKSADVPLTAAQEQRAHKAAMDLLHQSLDLLGANPSASPIGMDNIKSAGIPIGAANTMIAAQKFRVDWYRLDRKVLIRLARLVTERNWFARPVHEMNRALYGSGFRFATKEAADWAASGTYPFRRIQRDLMEEYLVTSAAVAFWRTEAPVGMLPMVEIPDAEDVEYDVVGGFQRIQVTVRRNTKIPESLKDKIGDKMWDCIRTGKRLEIIKGDPASGYDFEILKPGKTNSGLGVPALTGVMDDLDYIEAVRAGDWNGAYARREIIRHSKKGFGVSSGPNAGTTRNNAKWAELNAITEAMKKILGKQDMATNFDHDIAWLTFGKEFFSDEIGEAALRRLIFWGGLPAVMLLKTDSQITGLAALLYESTRAKVTFFREEFSEFLGNIFNAPSFRKNFVDAPRLDVAWSVNQLYSGAALNTLATTAATQGILSMQTIRELYGVDDERESERMLQAHDNRKAYTPAFEPRQGIVQGLFPEEFPDAGGQTNSGLPGAPGRPPAE